MSLIAMMQGFISPSISNPIDDGLINSLQGTIYDPADGGSTLDSSYTWALPQTRNFEQTLKVFKIYCTGAGTVKLKMLVPTNGGFNVTDIQTLNCSVGLNSFSVALATLIETVIPANALIAVKPGTAVVSYTVDSSEFHMGYIRFTGDVTGTNVISESVSYQHEIQAQFTTKFDPAIILDNVVLSDDCSGNVLPNYAINNSTNPWTFGSGKCVNTATGLANFLDLYPHINANDQFFKIQFEFTGAGDRICIYKKQILEDGGSNPYSTILEADLDNNRLVFYQSWTGKTNYTLPSIHSTLTLTDITLTTGVLYELELVKDNRLTLGIITDTTTGDREVLAVEGHPTLLVGYCYGRPGVAVLAGTVEVSDFKVGCDEANPFVLCNGDSITGGGTANQNEAYSNLIVLNSRTGRIEAEGGTLVISILKRMRHALRYCKPKYVVIQSVNNKNSAQDVTDYAAQMPEVIQECINAGAEPWLMVHTPMSNPTESTHQQSNRTFALAQSWNLIRTDTALSVGGDGFTYNASLMADSVHPNNAGHLAKYNQAITDCPGLIEIPDTVLFASNPAYDSDYKDFLNFCHTMSQITQGYELPTVAGMDFENDMIVASKAIGLWDASPVLMNLTTEGGKKYCLMSVKNPAFANRAVAIGRPIYVPKLGYIMDGKRSRIDTRFIPAAHGGSLFLQDDSAVAIYNNKVTIKADSVLFGTQDAGGTKSISLQKSGTANILAQMNQTGGGSGIAFASDYKGLIRLYRSASNAFTVEKNGADLGVKTTVSTGLSNYSINLGCWNKVTGQTDFCDGEYGLFVPHKFSSVGRVALDDLWDDYLADVATL